MNGLLIRNVEIEGRSGLDVLIEGGLISAIGEGLSGAGDVLDGRGGALIPGLIDHHIHLFATAAAEASLDLQDCVDSDEVVRRIAGACANLAPGEWLRAIRLPVAIAQSMNRDMLDHAGVDRPVRVLDRTGALWILNSHALRIVGEDSAELEHDDNGRATGRLWRGDAWLRYRTGSVTPSLAALGQKLAALGITGVTDASAGNDAAAARLLAASLPQRVLAMSRSRIEGAPGPVKILLDERNLPPFDDLVAWISEARRWHRPVAVHCVTAAELGLVLAAFQDAGSHPGDRIEHGGVIPAPAIPEIAALGLRVVTQSNFIAAQGDRYLTDVDATDRGDLYRCATLIAAGIPVAGSSDAPYGSIDCWAAMKTATTRRTHAGIVLGAKETVSPQAALNLYLGAQDDPGGTPRRVTPGAAADLCLLNTGLADALTRLSAANVAATIIGGRVM
ncbi:MAG: amidohydrolase [Sphingomonadales bacterium]|nr:amidohydrolase [Sphingomonadales bacterium]